MLHRFKLIGLLVILPIFVLLLHGGARAISQTTTDGAIDGTVYDAQSAVVPDATVTIRNEGTNAESVDKSDAQGYFKVIHLAPAAYTVTITANGFQTYAAEHTIVVVGQSTTMQPHLTIGSASQT